MGHTHGARYWNGYEHTDASWEAHEARHVFDIRDCWDWASIEATLQSKGLATYCGWGGEPENMERAPMEEWGTLSIRMAGILWLAERHIAQPETASTWWCEDCRCVHCGQPSWRPLSDYCREHRLHWEGSHD